MVPVCRYVTIINMYSGVLIVGEKTDTTDKYLLLQISSYYTVLEIFLLYCIR